MTMKQTEDIHLFIHSIHIPINGLLSSRYCFRHWKYMVSKTKFLLS